MEDPSASVVTSAMYRRGTLRFASENKNRILLVQGNKTGIEIP